MIGLTRRLVDILGKRDFFSFGVVTFLIAALLATVNITSRHALKRYVDDQLQRIPWDIAIYQTREFEGSPDFPQRMLAISGVKVRVEGAENAPAGEARIFVSNHRSWFDVFALSASLPGRCRFVAKKELARIPVFGRAWQVAGHICVDRGDRQSAVRSLEEAGNLMRANRSGVIIFAEGTRSRTDEMLPFKKGAFMLALHTSVDIVPIGVSGSAEVLGKGGFLVRPSTITIRIGPPIHTADYGFENRDRLMKRTRAEIERLSGRATEPSPAS